MENRKLIKFLIPILILGFFVANFNSAFAYEIETHAYLTSEVVKLYNQNFTNNKIDEELIPYLLDGARQEDDIPRWMNHFYDPVYNRGLTDSILGTWQKSKDWAQDDDNQNKLTYKVPATIASILSAIQQKKISALTIETNFTWQEAIRYWVNGDKEKAMFALGHTLHLMEDSSVPDHTRNDPHPGDSPYENYTQKFTLSNPDADFNKRLSNKSPFIFSDLNSYFDELAKYSNNNFYSKDRIGIQTGYKLPEPDYFKIGIDGKNYGMKIDKEFDDYFLIKSPIKLLTLNFDNEEFFKGLVLQDYWSRLSAKSVQYGAGVVNLFFQEVEKAKNDPNFTNTEEKSLLGKAIDSTKSFFAQVSSTVGNFFFGIFGTNQGFQPAGQVSLNDGQSQNSSSILGDQAHNIKIQSQEVQPPKTNNQSAAPINQIQEEADQEIIPEAQENQKLIENQIQKEQIQIQQTQPLLTFKECSFATSQSPSRQKIIINEVAWMGGSSDFGLTSTDEWIELKNISNAEVDVSNWQLIDKAEQIKINLGSLPKTKVAAGGFILLERTNDNSAPNVPADLIYSNTLNNSDEGLRLFDNQCNLIDEVLANPNWPAGDNTQKRTMERSPDLSWHTYNGTAQNNIFGTPKKENSQPTIISSGGGGGGSNVSTNNQQQTTTSTSTSSPEKILINEIEINPTTERFIELYNPNNTEISLTNWYLQRKTQTGSGFESLVSKTYFEGKTIPANGYFLISRSALTDSNIVISNFTLSESNTIQLKDSNQEVVDKAGWGSVSDFEGSGSALNPANSQSIQRKFQNNTFVDTNNNADDFEIQTCPSPKAQLKTCQQANQAPSAFFVYAPQNPIVGEIITFSAASSSDPDLDGQIVSYQWDFGDNITSAITTATTTHTYSTAGNYTTILVVFDNQNASSTATSTIISIALSGVVISEIYPDKTDNNFDFVELYNPTNSSVTLGDYSLKILKEEATSTTSLASFSTNNTIAAKSFFLIGLGSYNSTSTRADTSRTSNLLTTKTATIILYDNNNSVDEFNYNPANIANGQSLERKSFSGGVCVSSQNDNEFLGNACDTDSAADFEIRDTPNPQNSSSFPEPRNAPTIPQNFTVQYSSSTMELNFNWNASQDYNNSTSTLTYKITDISNSSSTLTTIETASITAKISINEIGRQYNFSIQAFDGNGLNSKPATSTISIQSFLSNLYFYQDPRASSTDYLIEAYYNQYPFAPDIYYPYSKNSTWKQVVFYLNSELPENVLAIKYKQCSGGSITTTGSLLLPDTASQCGTSGGAYNTAMNFSELEDNHFIIQAADLTTDSRFNSVNPKQNYLTVVFYATQSLMPSDGRVPYFQLVATDKTKYYFNQLPPHQKPIPPPNLQFSLDQTKSTLIVSLDKFADPDTLNNLLKYEISYNNENWRATSNLLFDEAVVEPNKDYNIRARAIDDFGLESDILTSSFTTPEISPPFNISKIEWGHLADFSGTRLNFNYSNDALPHMIIFYLNQLPPLNYNFSFYSSLDAIVLSPNAPSPYYGYRLIDYYDPSLASSYPHRLFRLTTDKNDASLPITALVGINLNKTLNDLTTDDFITLGFYNIDPWGNITPIGNDAHKYYFQILKP